jgi:hypothetical protein
LSEPRRNRSISGWHSSTTACLPCCTNRLYATAAGNSSNAGQPGKTTGQPTVS